MERDLKLLTVSFTSLNSALTQTLRWRFSTSLTSRWLVKLAAEPESVRWAEMQREEHGRSSLGNEGNTLTLSFIKDGGTRFPVKNLS